MSSFFQGKVRREVNEFMGYGLDDMSQLFAKIEPFSSLSADSQMPNAYSVEQTSGFDYLSKNQAAYSSLIWILILMNNNSSLVKY